MRTALYFHSYDKVNRLGKYEVKVRDAKVMKKHILTKREQEVFELLIRNKSTKEIAIFLGISEKTVRNHISNAMQKLGVKGRAQAVVELLKLGEIEL